MVLKIPGRRNLLRDENAIFPWRPMLMNARLKAAAVAPPNNPMLDPAALRQSATAVIEIEARAIEVLKSRIDASFLRACELMFECPGRVVVSGMGKSGHIARKIAATLA